MRVRVHLNGQSSNVFALKVPETWDEFVNAARQRLLQQQGRGSASRPHVRLFLSGDGAEVGSLEDLQEGDVIAIEFEGADWMNCQAVEIGRSPQPGFTPLSPTITGNALSQAELQSQQEEMRSQGLLTQVSAEHRSSDGLLKDRVLRGVRKGVELINAARRQGRSDVLCDVLRQLADVPRSPLSLTELLSESGVGVAVGGLQRHDNQTVSFMARRLVRHWKALVDEESQHVSAAVYAAVEEAARRDAAKRLQAAEAAATAEREAIAAAEREAAASEQGRREHEAARAERVEAKREARRQQQQRQLQQQQLLQEQLAAAEEARARAEAKAASASEAEAETAKALAALEAKAARARSRAKASREGKGQPPVEQWLEAPPAPAPMPPPPSDTIDATIQDDAEGGAQHAAPASPLQLQPAPSSSKHQWGLAVAQADGGAAVVVGTAGTPTRVMPPARASSTVAGAEIIDDYTDDAQGVRIVDSPSRPPTRDVRAVSQHDMSRASSAAPHNGVDDAGEPNAASGGSGRLSDALASIALPDPAGESIEDAPIMSDATAVHGADSRTAGGSDAESMPRPPPVHDGASSKATGRLQLRAGNLVLGAPLRQGKPAAKDVALGLVCAVSASAYHLRFMWRHPPDSPGRSGPVGICDNLRIDKRDMRAARYRKIGGGEAPPAPYVASDREILEGGELIGQAAGFRWRRLEDQAADALGLPPPEQQIYS